MKKLQQTLMGLILLEISDFAIRVGAVILATICIFASGAIIIPIFVLILLLRTIGLGIQADRLCAWIWKRTTRFTFK